MKKHIAIFFLLSVVISCSEHQGSWKKTTKDPENLHRSVKHVTDVIVHDIFSPPVASRIYAYMSIAGYEAAIQDDSRYASLAGQVNGLEAIPKPDPGLEYS